MSGARAEVALLALARRGSTGAALAGGVVVLAAAVLVAVDVLLRRVAGVSLGGADELSGYALAIGSTWSFAFVLLARGNVRIDALYQYLPPRAAAVCDLLGLAALLGFFSLVAWHGAGVLAQSWNLGARSNTALGVPLVVPQGLWWAGYAWFVGCAALLMACSLRALARGDLSTLTGLIGARGVQEEADEEVANAAQAAAGAPR